MARERKIIGYLTPAGLGALMAEADIAVHETGVIDGKPTIQAALKVANAATGEQLPGGLPFSVVMFKTPEEPGYTNIAIGAIVPAAELGIELSSHYIHSCNRRLRFARFYPLDDRSFVIQMDLLLRHATREYAKYGFGLWGRLFSQALFELMGRDRDTLIRAAEAYASANLAPQDVSTVVAANLPAEPVAELLQEAVSESALAKEVVDLAVPVETVAVTGVPAAEELPTEEVTPAAEPAHKVASGSVTEGPAEAAALPTLEAAPGLEPVSATVEPAAETDRLTEQLAEISPAFTAGPELVEGQVEAGGLADVKVEPKDSVPA